MRRGVLALCMAAVAVLGIGVGLSSGGTSAAKVTVGLKEFKLIPAPASVAAGPITFVARNTGKLVHELVIAKTTLAANKLPIKANKAVVAGQVGKIAAVGPGKTSAALTIKLAPGRYVLLCNVAGHYQAGQFATLVVR